jgi:hypothetical protein
MFASAMADATTLVVRDKKDKNILYIHKCQDKAESNKEVSLKVAQMAYDSGYAQTAYKPTGFAGLTLTREDVNYSNSYFSVTRSPETRTNVLMFFTLCLFGLLVLLIASRRSQAIGPQKFNFAFCVISTLVLTIMLISTALLFVGSKYDFPIYVYLSFLIVAIAIGLVMGIAFALLQQKQDKIKATTDKAATDKKAQKIIRLCYYPLAILLIFSVIFGHLPGFVGMLIIGAIIYLPIIGLGKLFKYLKTPRKATKKPAVQESIQPPPTT